MRCRCSLTSATNSTRLLREAAASITQSSNDPLTARLEAAYRSAGGGHDERLPQADPGGSGVADCKRLGRQWRANTSSTSRSSDGAEFGRGSGPTRPNSHATAGASLGCCPFPSADDDFLAILAPGDAIDPADDKWKHHIEWALKCQAQSEELEYQRCLRLQAKKGRGSMIAPEMYEAARLYARLGWPIIPVYRPLPAGHGFATCGKPGCGSPAKHPKPARWTEASFPPEEWSNGRRQNIGIVNWRRLWAGRNRRRRLAVKKTLARLERELGPLPPTIEAQTGSGGRHRLFKHPGGNHPQTM